MSALENAKPASFAGIRLFVEEVNIAWGQDFHLHKYPHRASAALEKLGRKPYEIQVSAVFDENIKSIPNLYPTALNALRQVHEEERSADLVLPTFGTIRAFLATNMQKWNAAVLSGERCQISFVEDSTATFTLEAQIAQSAASLDSQLGAFEDIASIVDPKPGLFDSLDTAVRDLLSVRDQVELAGNMVEAKALRVVSYCNEIERTVDVLRTPRGAVVLDAMKEIWATAQAIALDIGIKKAPIQTYVVPRTMTIQEVSIAIFGTTEKAFDILQLNAVNDAFAIPPATQLRYYADAA